MKIDRAARRCALQAMYQFDADEEVDHSIVEGTLEGSGAENSARSAGFALATKAWDAHERIDLDINEVSSDWPIRRQPMVDRNLIRLAVYEIREGVTPLKVAINEAVELAKEFGGEKSPGFVNAVLDELVKRPGDDAEAPPESGS